MSISKEDAEELNFVFELEIATEKDYELFCEMYNKNSENFKKVKDYFNKYYKKTIRKYTETNFGKYLKQLDEWFLDCWDVSDLEKYFEKKFLHDGVDENNYLWNVLIKSLEQLKVEEIKDIKFYFYLYMIVNYDESYREKILKCLNFENNILENLECVVKKVKEKKIELNLNVNNLKEQFSNAKEHEYLLFYIELSKLMKTKTYREALYYLKKMNIPSDCSEDLSEGIKLILEHFDSLEIKSDKTKYFDVYNKLLPKWSSNGKYERIVLFWFIEKDNKNQFKNLNSYKDNIELIIHELYNNKSNLIANLLLSISLNAKNNLHDLYNNIKDIMNKCIKEGQNKDYRLLYSLFYVWLLEKIKIYEKVKHIKIGIQNEDNKCINSNIHCIFLYLNEEVRNILLNKYNDIATIIKDIDKCDNNKTNYHFKYNKNYLTENELKDIESQVDKDVIGIFRIYKKVYKNQINKDKMVEFFKKFCEQNGHKYIIYFDFVLSFNEEDLKDIKVIETNEYYYELTGIFITDKPNNKYIILYNKYTFQWYYVHMSQWTNKLILPKKLNEVYLVYFRTNKSNKDEINLDDQLNYETDITLFNDENKDNDVYWKSFNNIESSYPNILCVKEPFFKSAFNWDKTKHSQNYKDNNLFVDEEDRKTNTETNKPIEETFPLIPSENKIRIPNSLNQNNMLNDNVYNSLDHEEDNKQNNETNQLNIDSDVSVPEENTNMQNDSLEQNNKSNYNSYILFANETTNSKPNVENNQVYNNKDNSIPVENLTNDMESLNINTDDTSSFLDQFEQLLQSETFDITKHIDLNKWINQQFHKNNQHNMSIKLLFYISFITLPKSPPSPLQTPKPISFNNQSILNEQILTNLTAISSSIEINPNINIQQLLKTINKATIKEHKNYLFLIQIIIYLLPISTHNNTQTFLKEESLSFEEQYLNDLIILLRFTNLEDKFYKYLSSLLTYLNYKEGTDTYKLNLKVLLNIYITIHIKNEHISKQCTFIDDFATHHKLIMDALMEHNNHKRIIDILTLFIKDNNYLKNKLKEEKINNIKQYLKDNYINIRQCIVNTLNESSQSQMLELFDNEFLDKNIDYDSLEYLEKYLFSENSSSCDDKLLNLIENNIHHIQDIKSYFYFFFISHSDNQWTDHIMNILYKEQSESLVKNMKHIYDIFLNKKMKDLFNKLKAPKAKTREEKELIFYTEIFTLIENNDKEIIINAFNNYIPNNCSKEDEDEINKRINLLLKYGDTLKMNYDNQYKSIVEMIISKIGNSDLKYSYEESCIIWLFEKENKNNFKLITCYMKLLEQRIKIIISIFDKHNKNELCANLILSLEVIYKNENVNLYENIKDIMNKCIKEEQNKDYHLLYSLFYIWLLEKIKIYDKVKHIHIGTYSIINRNVDVHCVFLYLHDTTRSILLNKENNMATLIKDIYNCDNNKIIDLFKYNKNYLPENEFEYIKSQVDENVIGWIQSNENTFRIQINKEKMIDCLKKFCEQNGYKYIIYFDFSLSFNEEDLKDIKRLEINEYYYELTGIFITDKSNNKHLIIYNKYTLQWYSFNTSKWSNSLILPNRINAVNLIYLRTNKDEINLDDQLNYETNITLFNDENKDNDIYWKSFKNIESPYPNILCVKEPFFKSAFNWDLLALQQQALSIIENIINKNQFYHNDKLSLINITNWLSRIYTNTYFTTINSKLLFYISYMLLYKTKKNISLSDSIFLAKHNILREEQLKNLQKLSSHIDTFTFSLKNILKRVKKCKTEEEIVYLFLNRIIILLEYIFTKNDNIDNLKEIVKVLCEDCEQLKPFGEKILENYFIEIIKYIQEHLYGYRLSYLSALTSILITNTNNGNIIGAKSGYYILKEFINKCLKEGKVNDCLDILIEGTETALKILYNHNDDYLIADLLMTSINCLMVDIFYNGCKDYLRDIYYNEQRPLQPILQYSILLFFLFARSKHANEKIKQMNNLIYMKNDPSTLVDITLMTLFTISDIRKIISKIKSKIKQKNNDNNLTQEEQDLINMYEIFLNSSEGKKIHYQKNTIFNNIKRAVGNDLYGTKYIDKVLNINNSIYNLKYEELKNLKNIQFDNVPYLLYVEYNNQIKDNKPYYKRFICNYNDQYYYEFKGITLLYNKTKDTLFYDKYSQHWYSFNSNSWQDELNFDVITNVKHIYFIYLRKKTTHKGRELHFNNLRNIPPIDEATFQQCYFDYSSTYLWFCNNNQKLAYLYKDSFTKILNTQIKYIQVNYKKYTYSNSVKDPSCLII